jgi:hypothetical protein
MGASFICLAFVDEGMKKEFALNDITSELTAQTDRTPKKLDIHGGIGGSSRRIRA